MKFAKRITAIFLSDTTSLIWTIGWLSMFMAFGFFYSETNNTNYDLINQTFPQHVWGFAFLFYGLIHILSCVFPHHRVWTIVNSIVGIWLWSYIFFSFNIFDKEPVKATEWLLSIPVIIEIWIFLNNAINMRRIGVCSTSQLIIGTVTNIRYNIDSLNLALDTLVKENASLTIEIQNLNSEVYRLRKQIKINEV
jgi:hypothetical protein